MATSTAWRTVAVAASVSRCTTATSAALVTSVSVSALGDSGPFGQRPGFDPIVQALSGIMRSQAGPDETDSPAFLTVPIRGSRWQ